MWDVSVRRTASSTRSLSIQDRLLGVSNAPSARIAMLPISLIPLLATRRAPIGEYFIAQYQSLLASAWWT